MKLKNISLIYYDEANKEHTQQLIRESSFILEHIVREMLTYSFFDCGRINFICCKNQARQGIREVYGICEMDIVFDPFYFGFTLEEKKRYLYDLLFSSVNCLCKYKQWDFSVFQNAFLELKNNNYFSSFYTKLSIKRNGRYFRLLGVQKIDKLSFFIEYSALNNSKSLIFLFDSKQSCFDYDRFLGKLEYKEKNKIALIGKDNKEIANADIYS